MTRNRTVLALVALLACAACAEKPASTMSLAFNQPHQVTSVQWDSLVGAQSAARVNNNALIQMR